MEIAPLLIPTILLLILKQNGLAGRMNFTTKLSIFLLMLWSMIYTNIVLIILRHLCHPHLMLHQVLSHLPSFLHQSTFQEPHSLRESFPGVHLVEDEVSKPEFPL